MIKKELDVLNKAKLRLENAKEEDRKDAKEGVDLLEAWTKNISNIKYGGRVYKK